jgi:probable F420-dependent oxidoreductase
VTLGYLAGLTSTIELVTAVIILPQRQAALVAKQAVEVDLLSGGRLRLGVGTGWNEVEYEALGQSFHDRGRRQEEQIELMRQLWAHETISFDGKWHRVTRAGIEPRPARPIPIWFGGSADPLLRRVARIGDGWIPAMAPNDTARALVEKLHGYLEAEGRDPSTFPLQGQAQIRGGDPERWARRAERWGALGATHLAVTTMNAGLAAPDDHIEAARRYLEAVR